MDITWHFFFRADRDKSQRKSDDLEVKKLKLLTHLGKLDQIREQ